MSISSVLSCLCNWEVLFLKTTVTWGITEIIYGENKTTISGQDESYHIMSALCPFLETDKASTDPNNSSNPPSLCCLVFCQLLTHAIVIWDERSLTEKNAHTKFLAALWALRNFFFFLSND